MFGWLKKKPEPERIEIRDTLFGDMSLTHWAAPTPEGKDLPPWTSLAEAKNYEKCFAVGEENAEHIREMMEFKS